MPAQTQAMLRVISEEIDAAAPRQPSPLWTLDELFARHYSPELLADRAETTLANYADALRWWRAATGDPPLRDVDLDTIERAERMLRRRLAAGTARKHCATLNRLLLEAAAGATGRGLRLIEPPPKLRPPRQAPAAPKAGYTPAEVARLLEAAARMRTPRLPDCPPPADWWRAFVGCAYLHAFRAGTLLSLEWRDLANRERQLQLFADTAEPPEWRAPAARFKSRRPLRMPAHPEALELLAAIADPPRRLIWPWYDGQHSRRFLHRQMLRLARLARLAPDRQLNTHALRRGHATELAAIDPEHARLSLGHSLYSTTARHYIDGRIAARAALQLTLKNRRSEP